MKTKPINLISSVVKRAAILLLCILSSLSANAISKGILQQRANPNIWGNFNQVSILNIWSYDVCCLSDRQHYYNLLHVFHNRHTIEYYIPQSLIDINSIDFSIDGVQYTVHINWAEMIQRAFNQWSAGSNLRFTPTPIAAEADINFAQGLPDHVPTLALIDTYAVTDNIRLLDDGENNQAMTTIYFNVDLFTKVQEMINQYRAIFGNDLSNIFSDNGGIYQNIFLVSLQTVVTHEIGHAMGLDHSPITLNNDPGLVNNILQDSLEMTIPDLPHQPNVNDIQPPIMILSLDTYMEALYDFLNHVPNQPVHRISIENIGVSNQELEAFHRIIQSSPELSAFISSVVLLLD